jgi:hypothetical protein
MSKFVGRQREIIELNEVIAQPLRNSSWSTVGGASARQPWRYAGLSRPASQ